MTKNRCVQLVSRPQGLPTVDNFALAEQPMPEPGAGEMLIRQRYLSVDPAMKGWIGTAANYSEPVALGAVMRSITVGEVVASDHPDYRAGQFVLGMQGWQDYAVSDGTDITRVVDPADGPISTALGVLGHNGLTAYFGLRDIGRPQPGDTVVVSTAAGAVGSAVGQIAKIQECRAVGITGGAPKAAMCREIFGYDAVIDYKASADLDARLAEACPDGIDVYFDNVGGDTLDAVLRHISVGGRIVVCGTVSVAQWDPPPLGPRVERTLLVKRAAMQGILIFDHRDEFATGVAQLSAWLRAGRLRYREDIVDGLESAPAVLAGLYRGANLGKALVRVVPDH